MLAALCATLVLVVAAAPATPERPAKRTAQASKIARDRRAHAAIVPSARPKASLAPPGQGSNELARARALLAEVKRDPTKRRYRDRWEKAITSLEKAARGRDTAPALLDAARARYALYRYSQVEADRTAAISLARRAEKAGAREAKTLRLAIRQEMGEGPEKEPPRPGPVRRNVAVKAVASAAPSTPRRPAAASAAAGSTAPVSAPPSKGTAGPSVSAMAKEARPAAPTAPGTSLVAGAAAASKTPPAAARTTPAAPTASAAPRPLGTSTAPTDEEGSIDAILERALAGEASPAEPEPDGSHGKVVDLKSWSNHEYTRVAIYLSRNVSFQRVDLSVPPDRPRQIAIDLRPAKLGSALAHVVGDALVQRVRATQLDPDTVRVTLDVATSEDLSIFPLEDPARLIVDVGAVAARRAPPAVVRAEPEPEPAPPRIASAPRQAPSWLDELAGRGPIRRVIVDAGHGGHDTGAIGPTNVREKDVTLSMAKRLAKRLRARGYEVVLTRADDRYVALEERTAIANARHGDLFVSLHANAHPRRDRRGVETYVLNVADDRYAARLAARENGALGDGANDIPVLRRILSDLDAKMSVESSRRVASAVQRELCEGIRARFGEVRDLGVKSALFYVLVGARMPAVLVETAFISNRAEERRLASAAFQDEVATAVTRAVDRVASADARIAAAP